MRFAREPGLNPRVIPAVTGRLRRGGAGEGHSLERLLDVPLLERAVAPGLLRECACKAIRGRLILIRISRIVTELHRHRMTHLMGDDSYRGHITVGAERVRRSLRHSSDEHLVIID